MARANHVRIIDFLACALISSHTRSMPRDDRDESTHNGYTFLFGLD